eukprot:3428247-Rhodomonas_salina.1
MDNDDVISDGAARKPLQELLEPPSQLDLGHAPCRKVIVRSLNVSPDLKCPFSVRVHVEPINQRCLVCLHPSNVQTRLQLPLFLILSLIHISEPTRPRLI